MKAALLLLLPWFQVQAALPDAFEYLQGIEGDYRILSEDCLKDHSVAGAALKVTLVQEKQWKIEGLNLSTPDHLNLRVGQFTFPLWPVGGKGWKGAMGPDGKFHYSEYKAVNGRWRYRRELTLERAENQIKIEVPKAIEENGEQWQGGCLLERL